VKGYWTKVDNLWGDVVAFFSPSPSLFPSFFLLLLGAFIAVLGAFATL